MSARIDTLQDSMAQVKREQELLRRSHQSLQCSHQNLQGSHQSLQCSHQSLAAWKVEHSAWHHDVFIRDVLRLLIMRRTPRVEDELLSLTPKPPGAVSKEIQASFQRHRSAVNRGVHKWTLAGLLAVLEFQHDGLIGPWIRASNPGIATVSHQEAVKLLLNVDWDVAHQIL
ncbi:MAG: hypothetical protein Q9187_004855, partial [Circinaria calcarea]